MSRYWGWIVALCLATPLACFAGHRHRDLLSQLRTARNLQEAETILSRNLGGSEYEYERFIQELTLAELKSLSPSQTAALTSGPLLTRLMANKMDSQPEADRLKWKQAFVAARLQSAKDSLQAVAPYPSQIAWKASDTPKILKALRRITGDVMAAKHPIDEGLARHMTVALLVAASNLVREEKDISLMHALSEHLYLLQYVRDMPLVRSTIQSGADSLAQTIQWRLDAREQKLKLSRHGTDYTQETLKNLKKQWGTASYGGEVLPFLIEKPCPYSSL